MIPDDLPPSVKTKNQITKMARCLEANMITMVHDGGWLQFSPLNRAQLRSILATAATTMINMIDSLSLSFIRLQLAMVTYTLT
jgi:hypothetical protein